MRQGPGGTRRRPSRSGGYRLVGAVLLIVADTVRGARRVLYGLGGALAVTLALWVENPFGIGAVAGATGFCLLAARYLPGRPVLIFVNFAAAATAAATARNESWIGPR